MARHYIGFTQRGPVVFRNVRMGSNRIPLILMHPEDITSLELNYTAYLASGETVSSATATAEGITALPTVATPKVTLALSSPTRDGTIEIKTTFSTGDVLVTTVAIRVPTTHESQESFVSWEDADYMSWS